VQQQFKRQRPARIACGCGGQRRCGTSSEIYATAGFQPSHPTVLTGVREHCVFTCAQNQNCTNVFTPLLLLLVLICYHCLLVCIFITSLLIKKKIQVFWSVFSPTPVRSNVLHTEALCRYMTSLNKLTPSFRRAYIPDLDPAYYVGRIRKEEQEPRDDSSFRNSLARSSESSLDRPCPHVPRANIPTSH
jgi:hypothetical protein